MTKNKFQIKTFTLIAFAFVFSIQILFSQRKDVVLYSGTIKNDLGEPIGTEIRFISKNLTPTIARSNSDGTYQIVVSQNKLYVPIFKGYVEIGGFQEIKVDNYNKYQELKRDFIIRQLKEGVLITKMKLFKEDDTLLSNDAIDFFKTFKEFYLLNKNLNFSVQLSAPNLKFKPKTITVNVQEKGKEKNKKVKLSALNVETEFLQSRANQLQKLLADLQLPLKLFDYKFDFSNKIGNKKIDFTDTEISINKILKLN